MAQSAMTIENALKELSKLRKKREELGKKYNDAKAAENDQKEAVLSLMEAQGVDQARAAGLTASVSENEVVVVDDWDKLTHFIIRNKALELMQRRISLAPYKEFRDKRRGKDLPGARTTRVKGLNISKSTI